MEKIILASQSPRRKQLLEWAEVPFDIIVKSTDETFPNDLPIEEVPIHIARQKAVEVQKLIHSRSNSEKELTILAADTIVVLDGQVIGKPADENDALNILTSLSGKTHLVITGVVILHNNGEIAFSDTTTVHFHQLNEQQLRFYIEKYKPYDKAGAYAIQEWIGVVGIKGVEGDFYNVMGLPVSRVVQELNKLQ